MTEGTPPLALVTGGCRRLGASIAAALALRGYALAVHGHHDAVPEQALCDVFGENGTEWHGFSADLELPGNAATLIADVSAYFGRVPSLLVNSASVFTQDRLDDVTPDRLATAFAVNCAAPVMLAQALATSSNGAPADVINILDQRIRHPHGDQFAYTLSKVALGGFTIMAGLPHNIRINGIAPGLTLPTQDYDDEQMQRLAQIMPLKKLPTPEQVADAVLFIAGTPSVRGQILYVDAGAGLVRFERDFMHLQRASE